MSQDDLSVANAAGATVRADMNSNFQALGSLMSGASAPATTWPNLWWADTANNVLKRRNNANSAWDIKASLDSAVVLAKTANYTLAINDFGKIIDATSGTWTLTLTAAATLTDGFWFGVRNSGTGVITIDPNASETIDGQTTLALKPGERVIVYCNGALFRSFAFRDPMPLQTQTADYTAVWADLGTVIRMNKATAVNLFFTAAATLGAGWWCDVMNVGAGTLTLDPNAAETIDGAATITKATNLGCRVYCDGTSFYTAPFGGGFTAAVQADQEAASSNTVGVTPGTQQFHPSALKAWTRFNFPAGTPTTLRAYNVSSYTDNGAGDPTINFTTAFSDTSYGFTPWSQATANVSSDKGCFMAEKAVNTGSFRAACEDNSGALNDAAVNSVGFYGDQ